MSSSRNEGESSSGCGSRKISVRSSDGVIFEVEEAVMLYSGIISLMIQDGCANDVIPLPTISSTPLQMVIQYYTFQACAAAAVKAGNASESESSKALIEFHDKFAQYFTTNPDTLKQVLLAANFLDMAELYSFAWDKYRSIH